MDIWDSIGRTLDKGRAYFEKNKMDECLEAWEKAWEQLKGLVSSLEIKPEMYEVDEATDYAFDIEGWLFHMPTAFLAAKRYEEGIQFCHEVIETFPWIQTAPDDFNQAIGEALELKGETEKCDAWYEEWLQREPDNAQCVLYCAIYLLGRNQTEQAEELVENLMKNKECNYETHELFMRAASFFGVSGNKEKEEYYRSIEQEYFQNFLKEPIKYGEQRNEDDEPIFYSPNMGWDCWDFPPEPIVKDKKVYPNEPCPCGSGRKYKKCCGKK